VALFAVLIPIMLLVVQSGATVDPTNGNFSFERASGNALNLAGIAALLALIAGLWLTAKLVPLFAVIVNERRGLGAFARSFRLTRGSALRLVGVVILYGIVVIVAMIAASSVTGVVARLLLGPDAAAGVGVAVGIVSSALTALVTVVQTVFYTRFYVAACEREAPAAGAVAAADAATDAHPLT